MFFVVLVYVDFRLTEIAGRDIAVAVVDNDDRDVFVLFNDVEYEIKKAIVNLPEDFSIYYTGKVNEIKVDKGLTVLKWVGISFGILILLVILFLTWFGLETSGTFMRMQDQPKLLRELKEMYDDKSLYVEEYESNSDGIFSVGSFDYTITSRDNPTISFTVEYPMTHGIPSDEYEDGVIDEMEVIRMVYNSSRLSLDGLYSIKKELNSHGLSNVEIFLEMLDVNDLEYNYGIGEGYDYGITEGYIYRIFVDKSLDVEDTVKQIVDTLTALDLDDYKIYLSFVDMEEYSRLSDSSEDNEFISTNSLINRRKNKKDVAQVMELLGHYKNKLMVTSLPKKYRTYYDEFKMC